MEPVFSEAWFETFGRGDAEQTEREVEFLLDVLLPPPANVLDVPCGFGRHARALARRGYQVTGVEGNEAVAAEARRAGLEVHVLDVRGLRELPGSFDAVICMWASFGWFDDQTNADVLAQMAEKARPGGVVVLDLYDPAWFRAHQGPREVERNGRRVLERKQVVGNRLSTTLAYEDGARDRFDWRLYAPDELRALGAAHGLDCEAACAGFDLASAPMGETARMQLVFRRRRAGTASRVDEPIALPAGEGDPVKADRPELTLLEVTFDPGSGVDPHFHKGHSDSFYVLEGELEFHVGDEVFHASAGAYVLAPPNVVHFFRNVGDEPARMLNLHTPGGFARYRRELGELRAQGIEPDRAFFERHDVFDV